MARVRLQGNNVYEGGSIIGRVDGTDIHDSSGHVVGKIRGEEIQDTHSHTVGRVQGNNVYDGSGRRLCSMSELRNNIDGPGGVTLAAIWILLVR